MQRRSRQLCNVGGAVAQQFRLHGVQQQQQAVGSRAV
jgi:hypothetical protein